MHRRRLIIYANDLSQFLYYDDDKFSFSWLCLYTFKICQILILFKLCCKFHLQFNCSPFVYQFYCFLTSRMFTCYHGVEVNHFLNHKKRNRNLDCPSYAFRYGFEASKSIIKFPLSLSSFVKWRLGLMFIKDLKN